ncbi:MAG: archaellar assembly protein FlaJ [Dehalococcoidia bacterium]|nr:archaellar assembly protein FlaJ [Dehalococcoidia bacterium]
MDLYSQVAYMAGIATAGMPRNKVFEYSARLPYCTSVYFRRVQFMARKLNYNYAEACRVVGDGTKEPDPKALLLRLSGSLTSGESESAFLQREAAVMGEHYSDEYERKIDSLRKWSEAYTSLILSSAIIVTVGIVSMLIYPISPSFIMTLSALCVCISGAGPWLLYTSAPREVKTHDLSEKSKEQVFAAALFRLCVPAAVAACVIMAAAKIDLGWIMIAGSALLLPPGVVILRDDRNIDKRDTDIPTFLRALGSVTSAIGTNVTEGMSRLDMRFVGSLQASVNRLQGALGAGVKPDLCWWRFIAENGSELVKRSTHMFWDGVRFGGSPNDIGRASSDFAAKMSILRGKRSLVAGSFTWLCVAMHTAICGLLVMIYEIMMAFSTAIEGINVEGSEVMGRMPSFGIFNAGAQIELLRMMIITIILVQVGGNAFAIKTVEGGHEYKLVFYVAVLLGLAGLCLVLVPQLSDSVFSSLPEMA